MLEELALSAGFLKKKSGVVGSKYWIILFYHKNTNEMTIIDTERWIEKEKREGRNRKKWGKKWKRRKGEKRRKRRDKKNQRKKEKREKWKKEGGRKEEKGRRKT